MYILFYLVEVLHLNCQQSMVSPAVDENFSKLLRH